MCPVATWHAPSLLPALPVAAECIYKVVRKQEMLQPRPSSIT